MPTTFFHYNTPHGAVTIQQTDGKVSALRFGRQDLEGELRPDPVTNEACNQLLEYLSGKRREFDLPLYIRGTQFQRDCYNALLCVPYGETRSYAELAASAGHPKAFRAVGGAMHVNPLAIFVPCHRVVASNGGLGGYASGLKNKRFLLDLEQGYK